MSDLLVFLDNHQGGIMVLLTFVQGGIMVLLTFVYVVATIVLVRSAHRSNQIALKNMQEQKELEQERIRPFVFCEFIFLGAAISFQISNHGMTAAKNIRCEFSEPLYRFDPCGIDKFEITEKEEILCFNKASGLAPGRSLDAVIGYYEQFKIWYPELKITCTVHYESVFGKKYLEEYVVVPVTSTHLGEKTVEDGIRALESMKQTLNHIATGLRGPLITQTVDDNRKETEKYLHGDPKKKIIIP